MVYRLSEETAGLIQKLREIEEQADYALQEVSGLTASRIRHIRVLAKFIRTQLQGNPPGPIPPLPGELAKRKRSPE